MAARPDSDTKGDTKGDPKGKRPNPAAQKDELEQYGVWVKAEPQDIALEPEGSGGLDDDFSLPEEGEALPEESFLTAEEERLLGSFGDIDESEGSTGSLPEPEADFSLLPDIEDFDDSSSETLEATKSRLREDLGIDGKAMDLSKKKPVSGALEPSFSPSTELDMSTIEGLDDFSTESGPSLVMEEDFSIDEEEGLADDLPLSILPSSDDESETSFGPELEDVSADFLDLEDAPPAKAKAKAPVTKAAQDVTDEFLAGDDASPGSASSTEEADFEPLDIELQFDDTLPSSAGSQAETGFEEISDFDDFLKDDASMEKKEDFDDLGALEKELSESSPDQSPEEKQRPRPAAVTAAEPSLANELLLKIANELSSIRTELVNLKVQMSSVRAEAPVAQAAPPPMEEESQASGGFFDDEDDEKIALTGDELDNILNSADFTEEIPTSEGESPFPDDLEFGTEILDSETAFGDQHDENQRILDETLLPESGDYSSAKEEEAPIERISLDDESGAMEELEGESLVEGSDGIEDLLKIASDGVHPLTPPPEDTSYLEEPLASDAVLEESATSFVEAPLAEPDLSDLGMDMDEGTEEIEVSGESTFEESDAGLPDMTLDLDLSGPAVDAESLGSVFEDEAIPEFEESEYEEISLAKEGNDSPKSGLDGGSDAEEGFVEFIDDDLLEEEVLHHESPLVLDNHEEEEISDLAAPGAAKAEDEGIVLSSRAAKAAVSASEEIADDMELGELDEGEPEELDLGKEPTISSSPAASSKASPVSAELDPADKLKSDIRSVLSYLDRLLESLPEEKIEEFAHSEHFDTYKKLFEELGLV